MKMLHPRRPLRNKGQATAELAIMGAIVLMLLSYLVSQGFLYNNRQAMEMYTFRKALQLSKQQERGINLTVIRDVITPSFFTGLSRQRLMSTSIVEYNPWIIWDAKQSDPQDVASLQLLQVNDAMILGNNQQGYFLEIPPTLVDTGSGDGPRWGTSAVEEIDPQDKPAGELALQNKVEPRTSYYSSTIKATENPNYITAGQMPEQGYKKTERENVSDDKIPLAITFQSADKIRQNYKNDNWDGKIGNPDAIPIRNIPPEIVLNFNETLRRDKTVVTYNPKR